VLDAPPLLGAITDGEFNGTYLDGLSIDQMHPNDAGHAAVARAFPIVLQVASASVWRRAATGVTPFPGQLVTGLENWPRQPTSNSRAARKTPDWSGSQSLRRGARKSSFLHIANR
jgi:hypothetical protein